MEFWDGPNDTGKSQEHRVLLCEEDYVAGHNFARPRGGNKR